jgi:hypothetical protein
MENNLENKAMKGPLGNTKPTPRACDVEAEARKAEAAKPETKKAKEKV